MTSRPRITAALITLNEQRHLPALLERLDWVNEIVVVDGGSSDDTVAIARRHGSRVVEHPFDTFAQQRNRAIELASSEWILSIDADERPTPAAIREIQSRIAVTWPSLSETRSFVTCARASETRGCDSERRGRMKLRGHEESPVAFRVPIRSRIFGRPFRFSGTQDDRPIRLFRRGAATWTGDVHEVLQVRGPLGTLRAGFDHETLPTLASFLQKMDRYTTLEARRRVAASQPPRWRDRALAPAIEVGRRLIWKQGLLDGPEGWLFCLLSGLSQWVLADKHRRWWRERAVLHNDHEISRAAAVRQAPAVSNHEEPDDIPDFTAPPPSLLGGASDWTTPSRFSIMRSTEQVFGGGVDRAASQ